MTKATPTAQPRGTASAARATPKGRAGAAKGGDAPKFPALRDMKVVYVGNF